MPVKIRLMRIGAKQRPFYRIVAVDERRKRTGGYLELLGTYNPLTQPKEINLLQDKIDAWMKKGAQPSDGFLRIIGKAKQRLPRKAKKEKKGGAAPAAAPEAVAKDEAVQEENAPESFDSAQDKATAEEAAPVEVAQEETTQEAETQAEPAADEAPAEATAESFDSSSTTLTTDAQDEEAK